jgi:hypothetical protein
LMSPMLSDVAYKPLFPKQPVLIACRLCLIGFCPKYLPAAAMLSVQCIFYKVAHKLLVLF